MVGLEREVGVVYEQVDEICFDLEGLLEMKE